MPVYLSFLNGRVYFFLTKHVEALINSVLRSCVEKIVWVMYLKQKVD